MMNYFYMLMGAVLLIAAPAWGQTPVRSIDSIRVRTDSPEDPTLPRQLVFGYGTDYTDSVDDQNGKGEFFLPFGPPSGFYATLEGKGYQGETGIGYKDVRGLPDSVGTGKADTFSLVYTIKLQQGVGTPIIAARTPLAGGIDSIHLYSTQPGSNFDHTFTREGGEVKLPFKQITTVRMVVYFSYERTLSVPMVADAPLLFGVAPNPARAGEPIRLRGEIPAGSRVVVSDMRGAVTHSMRVDEATSGAELALPGLVPGAYMIRVIGRSGVVVGEGWFVSVR
jgi:hypothetical protein